MSTNLFLASAAASSGDDTLNGIITMGGELFESDIDAVIFQTNEFLTDASFTCALAHSSPSSQQPAWPTR